MKVKHCFSFLLLLPLLPRVTIVNNNVTVVVTVTVVVNVTAVVVNRIIVVNVTVVVVTVPLLLLVLLLLFTFEVILGRSMCFISNGVGKGI